MLIIPMYVADNRKKVESSSTFMNTIIPVMDDCDTPEEKETMLSIKLSKWCSNIASETALSKEIVEAVLKDIYLTISDDDSFDVNSVQYKLDEYRAFQEPITLTNQLQDFYREEMDVSQYSINGLKRVVLVKKLREVQALIGFSRLEPINGKIEEKEERFVSIKNDNVNWYPGSEVYGEGIFLEFDNAMINDWSKQDEIIRRVEQLRYNNEHSNNQFVNIEEIDAKFVLLHTIAHLLIKQLSFECGYNVASLKERIYSSSDSENPMSGILIYTASGDSEGTLGGLVRQGKPDSLTRIFNKSVEEAKICSNDPVCILSNGQGRNGLNLAACYACGLLPETSCEFFNMYLDRVMLIGSLDDNSYGFFTTNDNCQ